MILLAALLLALVPFTNHAAATCESAIDLVLLLDGSSSIRFGKFDNELKPFAKSIVASFNVTPTGAHIGVIQFSGKNELQTAIQLSSDPGLINAAIDQMQQINGNTDIEGALRAAQSELNARGRPGVPDVVVLLTDGRADENTDPIGEAAAMKAVGTVIFAIGVGEFIDLNQLVAIASPPSATHVFTVGDFDQLSTKLQELVVNVCAQTGTDLAVTKAAGPNPIAVGGLLTYTIAVHNNGPGAASNVALTDTLPAGMTFLAATPSQGTAQFNDGSVTCNLGSMPFGATATVTINVETTAAGTICNTAQVAATESDAVLANNSATVCISATNPQPATADLVLTKTAAPNAVLLGSDLLYTLTVSNRGPEIATGIVLEDSLPDQLVLSWGMLTQGTWSSDAGVVTCQLGDLAPGQAAAVVIAAVPALAIAPTRCESAIDLVFVIDSSGSIAFCGCAAFDKMKMFAHNVVTFLAQNSVNARVGIVDFSSQSDTTLILGLTDDTALAQATIANMPFFGNGTDIAGGLALAHQEILASGRPEVNRVLVLLTDGKADDGPAAQLAASAAKSTGTEIFAVGVGSQINVDELNALASSPAATHVFPVNDFDGLAPILNELVVDICPPLSCFGITNTACVQADQNDPDPANNLATVTSMVLSQPPRLAIRRAGSQAVISWRDCSGRFVLQTAESPVPALWTNVPTPPTFVGEEATVTVGITGLTRCYRLVLP
jgi:uncharacterized repeat protein (TIGR01451 family)